MRRVRRTRRPLVALVTLVVALVVGYGVKALSSGDHARTSGSTSASTSSARVPLSSLPQQAGATVHLIEQGGPFPYPRNDGVVFRNNERHLPSEPTGYYHEYTVPTPGSRDRGARRMIMGGGGEFWYTGDHYATFQRVDVNR